VVATVTSDSVRFSGVVPDAASIESLVEAGEAAWGPNTADGSGLSEGSTTWTEGRVTVEGVVPPGEGQLEALVSEIRSRFGQLVEVDVSGVGADTSAVEALEAEITADLQATPILFAPVSADIEAASDATLANLAERLNAVPEVQVEVVGHTDSLGNDDENLLLSQQRAQAVVDRLVELGVDAARLGSRGEGENQPLVSNDTEDGRAQNRRIEFLLFLPGSAPDTGTDG
jgi:outer membrane protein OmpA-like peptidoglycan-associated protein